MHNLFCVFFSWQKCASMDYFFLFLIFLAHWWGGEVSGMVLKFDMGKWHKTNNMRFYLQHDVIQFLNTCLCRIFNLTVVHHSVNILIWKKLISARPQRAIRSRTLQRLFTATLCFGHFILYYIETPGSEGERYSKGLQPDSVWGHSWFNSKATAATF